MFKCTLCGIELQKKYMLGHFVSKTHAKKKKEYNLKLPEHQTINEDLSKLDRFGAYLIIINDSIVVMNDNYALPKEQLPDSPQVIITQKKNQMSVEMLLHLFCVEKNISVQSEKQLFKVIEAKYLSESRAFTCYVDFMKQLKSSDLSVPHTNTKCHIKHPQQKNYKPYDVEKLVGCVDVPVYDIKTHLEHYLRSEEFSAAVILKPTQDRQVYSSFCSGEYFVTLCDSLPKIIPLCCKSYNFKLV